MSLEKMVGNMVRGIAVASSLYSTGCGTTIHTPRGEVWYDCNTNEDYPQGHPCYAEVKAYKAKVAAASSSNVSSSSSGSEMTLEERRFLYGGEPNGKKGHCERPRR